MTDLSVPMEFQPEFGQVLLFRGRGFISRLIRWQTRGKFSHAAISISPDKCIEAWQGDGVRIKRIIDWSNIEIFSVPSTPRQRMLAVNFAAQQIGKKYDYLGVLRFLSRRNRNNPNRWFCSELVYAAFAHAGLPLLNRVAPWQVSPSALSMSPFLLRSVISR